MPETVKLSVNGIMVTAPAGAMVSTAVALAGVSACRNSVSGEPRAPLCGMRVHMGEDGLEPVALVLDQADRPGQRGRIAPLEPLQNGFAPHHRSGSRDQR